MSRVAFAPRMTDSTVGTFYAYPLLSQQYQSSSSRKPTKFKVREHESWAEIFKDVKLCPCGRSPRELTDSERLNRRVAEHSRRLRRQARTDADSPRNFMRRIAGRMFRHRRDQGDEEAPIVPQRERLTDIREETEPNSAVTTAPTTRRGSEDIGVGPSDAAREAWRSRFPAPSSRTADREAQHELERARPPIVHDNIVCMRASSGLLTGTASSHGSEPRTVDKSDSPTTITLADYIFSSDEEDAEVAVAEADPAESVPNKKKKKSKARSIRSVTKAGKRAKVKVEAKAQEAKKAFEEGREAQDGKKNYVQIIRHRIFKSAVVVGDFISARMPGANSNVKGDDMIELSFSTSVTQTPQTVPTTPYQVDEAFGGRGIFNQAPIGETSAGKTSTEVDRNNA